MLYFFILFPVCQAPIPIESLQPKHLTYNVLRHFDSACQHEQIKLDYTVLFLRLGIPAPGSALAISIDLIMDFLLTACNLFCLQSELTLLSGDMDMLDTRTLFRE